MNVLVKNIMIFSLSIEKVANLVLWKKINHLFYLILINEHKNLS